MVGKFIIKGLDMANIKASELTSNSQNGDGAGYSFTTSSINIDTSIFKADIPKKGTYMVYVNATFLSVGSASASVRLWNNTLSQVVTNSYRYVAKNDSGPSGYATEFPGGLLWKVTVSGPTTFYLQGKASSDTNGGVRGIVGSVGYEMGYFKA